MITLRKQLISNTWDQAAIRLVLFQTIHAGGSRHWSTKVPSSHCGLEGKESTCSVGDPGLILGSGRSPGEENGNPLQNSCPENSIDRGVSQATVHGVTRSQTQLSDFTFTFMLDLRKGLLRSKADTIQERKGKRGKE